MLYERRLVRVDVPYTDLLALLQGKTRFVPDQWPADAQIVDVRPNWEGDVFTLKVWSSTYMISPEGCQLYRVLVAIEPVPDQEVRHE